MIALGDQFGSDPEYPVFVRRGDARREIEELVRRLGPTPEAAGLHKIIYASRGDQTVVLVTGRRCALATELRALGWTEPQESAGRHGD